MNESSVADAGTPDDGLAVRVDTALDDDAAVADVVIIVAAPHNPPLDDGRALVIDADARPARADAEDDLSGSGCGDRGCGAGYAECGDRRNQKALQGEAPWRTRSAS